MAPALDPYSHLSPEETASSIQELFPGQATDLDGLIDSRRTVFEKNGAAYGASYDRRRAEPGGTCSHP